MTHSSRTQGAERRMVGPVSIYAIAEMNKRAEEYTLKVRSELFRIGCSPNSLQVLRQGVYLQLKHEQQIILVRPQEILGVLQKIPVGTPENEVWEVVCQKAYQRERRKTASLGWSALVFVGMLLLVMALILGVPHG